MLTVGGHSVLHGTFEPGWRWSEHIRPIAGMDSREAPHLLAVREAGRTLGQRGLEQSPGGQDEGVVVPATDKLDRGRQAVLGRAAR